jgi:hypothetical protein
MKFSMMGQEKGDLVLTRISGEGIIMVQKKENDP